MAEQQITVRFRAQTAQLERGARQASGSLQGIEQAGERASRIGRTMTRRVTPAIAAVGAAATTAGMDFESSMLGVQAVSGETGATLDQMSDQARELGQTTQFSAGEAADALGFLSMAGFEAEEAMSALPDTLDLAAASGMELARSADLASNVLQQYALDAEEMSRVSDVLAEASRNANTDVEQLGSALEMAGPIANAAGIDLEESAAAIGAMSDAGIQGSRAGTSLRQALSQLTSATGPAAETLDELGVQAEAADGSIRPLPDIIDDLGDAGADAGDLMDVFGQRAGPAMASLVEQGGDALRELEVDLRDSAGAAAEMAETRMEGLEGSLRELRSALSEAGIAIFESGLGEGLEAAADAAAEATRGFAELPDGLQRTMVFAGGAAAAIGPLASGVGLLARNGRRLLGVMGLLNPKLAAASAVAGVLGAAYGALTSDTVDQVEAEQEFAEALAGTRGEMDSSIDTAIDKRVEDEELADAAHTLGLETRDLVDAIRGEDEARRRVRGAIDEHIDDSTRMGNTISNEERAARELDGAMDDLSESMDRVRRETIRRELDDMGVSIADLDDGLRETVLGAYDLEAALEALPRHLRPVEDASDDTADGLRDVEAAADDAAGSVDTFRQALDELYGEARDLEEAHRDLLDELANLEDQFDDTTGTLDIHSEAGRENRESLQQAAEAVGEHASAVYDSTGDIREARGAADEHYDSLLDQAEAAGISRDAVEDYLEELGLTPEEIETAIRLESGDAEASLQRITQRISELPDSHTVRVRTSGAGIPPSGGTGGGGGGGGQQSTSAEVRHTGGIAGSGGVPTRRVQVAGSLASDEVPAILERGELVVPNAGTSAAAPVASGGGGGDVVAELRRLREQLGTAMALQVDGEQLGEITDRQRQRRASRSLAIQQR